jgi:hypothetical protein
MYMPPMPNVTEELRNCISQAMLQVDKEMLDSIWAELEYHWDISHVTKAAHTEHL